MQRVEKAGFVPKNHIPCDPVSYQQGDYTILAQDCFGLPERGRDVERFTPVASHVNRGPTDRSVSSLSQGGKDLARRSGLEGDILSEEKKKKTREGSARSSTVRRGESPGGSRENPAVGSRQGPEGARGSQAVRSEDRYRDLFQNAVTGMFQTTRDGRFLTVNRAFAEMHGFDSPEEIISAVTSIDTQIYVDDSERERLRKEIDDSGFIEGHETCHIRKNGDIIWVSLSVRAVRDAEGVVLCYEGTCEDITRRRRAEEELRNSRQKYQALVEYSNVVVWEVNREGFITYINSAPHVLRGYRPETVVGKHFTEFLWPEDGEKVARLWEHLYETGSEVSGYQEVRVKTTTGGPRWIMTSGEFVRDPKGRIVGRKGIGIDVTDRKLMETALARSESTYRTIFENTGTATIIYDEDTTIISHANPEALLLTGCERRELEGRSWVTLVAPEDRERLLEYNRTRKDEPGSAPKRYEFRLVTTRGDERDVSITLDKIPGTTKKVAAVLDVTDWKRAEKALRENEKKYRTLFENANDAIFLMKDGRFMDCNSRTLAIFGCLREEIIGCRPDQFSPPFQGDGKDSVGESQRRIGLALAGEPQLFEWRHRRRDGSLFDVEVHLASIGLGGARIVQAIVRDITERKQAERALLESEAKFRDLVEKSLVGVYLIQDGAIRYVNSRVAETLEYTVEELTGPVALEDLIFPEDWPLVRENLRERTEGEVESRHYEFRVCTRTGSVRDIEVFSSRTSYLGRPACIGTLLDITERKRAEEALRVSDTRLRQVIDLVPHFIFAKDRKGRFILVNKTVADMYGTTVEGLTGKTDADFNDSAEEVEHFLCDDLAVMDSGQPMEIPEEQITDAAGRTRILQTTKIPFTLSMTGDDAVIGVATDITERKQAEKALRESEEKYRHIFEHAVEGIFQTTPQGRFLSVNPSFARMFGYESSDDLIGNITDIGSQLYADTDERDRFRELMEGKGQAEGFEARMRHRDGPVLWVSMNARAVRDEAGGIACIEGTVEDITERKKGEQALLESEAKYRSVVENSLVAFYIVQDNLFRFVNTTFCLFSGYSFPEIVDRMGPMDIVHPDDREKVGDDMERQLSGARGRTEYEFKAVRKDGSILTVKTIGNALTYNGRPAATGTLIDITRERTLEAQLRQAQKVEALGQLAGGIAHDFNNILTVLTGYASLVNMRLDKDSPLRMYVDQILAASQKASSLTNGLLTFSRKQPITLSPVDINRVVIDTEKLLKRLLTEDITMDTRLAAVPITIMADVTQLDQILFNLTTNARDAMKKGGVLAIETRLVTLDREFCRTHGFGEPGRYALLTVSDTGTGMDEATRERMFDPFFTTKEVGKGTGLGLSTVYGIVKQHCGHISVHSKPGFGTSFNIYLPEVRAEADEGSYVPEVMKRGKETILVAEDDGAVRRFMREALTLHGYTVIEAVDGQDAVEKFGKHGEVDLLILDSVMPRKNGREAYDTIVSMESDTRVLFVSGYTRDVVLDKGIQDKEFAFISKPLSLGSLLKAVREVLDG